MQLPDYENQKTSMAGKTPSKTKNKLFLIPFRFRTLSIFFIIIVSLALAACNSDEDQGQFELDLFVSVFGDISVTQGESATATVLIDRDVDAEKFSSNISISIIDPPTWLSYNIADNPVIGTSSAIKFDIGQDARPGIYRFVLHGVGNVNNTVIEDNVTFHILVKEAPQNKGADNSFLKIKHKILSLLKLD